MTFFNIVNKLSVKCAGKINVNGEIDYVFMKNTYNHQFMLQYIYVVAKSGISGKAGSALVNISSD